MRVKTGSDQANLFDILSHADAASHRKSSLDRLGITDWDGRLTQFFYDANSRLTRVELPNGTQRVYEYDFAGRVERERDLSLRKLL